MYQLISLTVRRSLFLLFLLAPGFYLPAQTNRSLPDLKLLDGYYQKAMQDWQVPGMAIAIVKNDSVLFAKGYGVLNASTGGAVDENTVFGIASNTKAFTAAALAMLVDEGKLKWTDPVTNYLPYFQLYNPYVTQAITIKDLLSHRVGLATFSGDLLWYNTTYSREEIIRRARHLEPVYGFRDGYGYSNIMFIVAGQVIEAISGQSWERFVQARIFEPLGMQTSYTSVRDLTGKANIASPHSFDERQKPVPSTFTVWDNWNPAAGIFTSVNQHAQWIRLQLNRGTYKGKRLFSEAASRTMWAPNQPIFVTKDSEMAVPTTHFVATALGWFVNDYQGRKTVYHSGGHEGMNSRVVLVPEENLGIVILTNSMSSIMAPLANQTIDAFLGVKNGRDWSQYALAAQSKPEPAPMKRPKVKKIAPSLPLTAYAGRYTSKLYGDATVNLINGQLEIQLVPAPVLKGKLVHAQHDIFQLDWKNNYPLLTPTKVRFLMGESGTIDQMRLDANNPDFIFSELDFRKIK